MIKLIVGYIYMVICTFVMLVFMFNEKIMLSIKTSTLAIIVAISIELPLIYLFYAR